MKAFDETNRTKNCYSDTFVDVVITCGAYVWLDGITYTEDNTNAVFIIPEIALNGCDSIIILDLSIVEFEPDFIIDDYSISVVSNINTELSYSWYECDFSFQSPVLIPFVNEFEETLIGFDIGFFAVEITSTEGCYYFSDCMEIISLDIKEWDIGDENIVYPNPSTDFIHFKRDNVVSFSLFNTDGKCVLTINELKNNKHIAVSGFSKGVYYSVIKTSDGSIFKERIILL